MGPIFERVAARYGDRINFAKVDTQSLPKLGTRHGVKSIPTIIAFSGRKEAKREVGLLNERRMKNLAEELLPSQEEFEEQDNEAQEHFQGSQAGDTEEDSIVDERQEAEDQSRESTKPTEKVSGKVSSAGGFTKRLRRWFGGGKK